MKYQGLMGAQQCSRSSRAMWPSRPQRTYRVASPVQTTWAKEEETWLNTPVWISGSMDEGQERDAGTDAGSHDAHVFVALVPEPMGDLKHFQHGLAGGLKGPPDIGADHVFGADFPRRHPPFVVGQGEAHGGDPQASQQPAESHVAGGVGVPLGNHDDGPAPIRTREDPGVDRIVDGVGAGNRGSRK